MEWVVFLNRRAIEAPHEPDVEQREERREGEGEGGAGDGGTPSDR